MGKLTIVSTLILMVGIIMFTLLEPSYATGGRERLTVIVDKDLMPEDDTGDFMSDLPPASQDDIDMPKASRYHCDIYCRDPRESVIWSNRYDFSKCSCQRKTAITQSFSEKDVTAFFESYNNYDKLEEILGKSETLTSRLTKSYKVFTPVAAFMIDVLTFIIGVYWGQGFGTTAAIFGSFLLFFSKGGSFYGSILSALIRIAIGQVSPGMRDFNYVAIIAVLVQVLTIAIGTTAGSLVAVPLLFLATITSYGIIVMLTQSNKFRMDVVVSIILITMQFIQTIGQVLPVHFVTGRSFINLLVLIVRALCNSSTSNSDLITNVVYTDVVSSWASMPLSVFTMFEDLETALFAISIFFLIIRVASVISMRLMLAQIPFKDSEKNHSFTEWLQRISMTCLYFPFKRADNYSFLQGFVNVVFFLWTFRCSFELLIILVICVIVSWMILGDFCVNFDLGKGRIGSHKARKQIERHFIITGDEDFNRTVYGDSVVDAIVERHIEFLKNNATLPSQAVKMMHQWDVAIRTGLGHASAVFVGDNQILTVKHVFMDVEKALPKDVTAYEVQIMGQKRIPCRVEAGNSDIDGETILRLSFDEPIVTLNDYPAIGELTLEDYAFHSMCNQGTFSFTHEVYNVDGRPQLIGYEHECRKSDSGRAGYAVDGTPKLVSLHVGATAKHNCGLLIQNSERPFKTVAEDRRLDSDRWEADNARGDEYPVVERIDPPKPLRRHVGVRKKNTPVPRPTVPNDVVDDNNSTNSMKVLHKTIKFARKSVNRAQRQMALMKKDTSSVVTILDLLTKLENK